MSGRRHIRTLMRRMGIEALYRKPGTSKAAPGHTIYPYLLRGWRSRAPTRSGRWTSPTSRWRAASCTSLPVVDWPAARCWRTRCRSRWRPTSAMEAIEQAIGPIRHRRDRQHRPGQPVHGRGVHPSVLRPGCKQSMDGRGPLARQRLRRAPVAQREVRGGVPESLRQRQRGARRTSGGTSTSTTRAGRTARTTGARRTWSTSPRCRDSAAA